MGIYVAKASAIKDLLTQHFPSQHDFGSDIIPGAKDLGFHVQACPVHGDVTQAPIHQFSWTCDNHPRTFEVCYAGTNVRRLCLVARLLDYR